jgi:hypothetical protein
MKRKRDRIITLVLVLVVIVAFSVFYLMNQNDLGRRGNLVGDGICGNYVSEEDRDGCCATVHSESEHEDCVGGWEYLSGIEFCQYVCSGQEVECPEDVKVCDDGRTVERNASNECFFDEC